MTTANVRTNPNNSNKIEVTGYLIEDFIRLIIEKHDEGFEIEPNSIVANSLAKSCTMYKSGAVETVYTTSEQTTPEDGVNLVDTVTPEVTEQEPVEVTQEELIIETVTKLDNELIESFDSDKKKLEEYGKEFGVDLNRQKSFKNMLKDLRKHTGDS